MEPSIFSDFISALSFTSLCLAVVLIMGFLILHFSKHSSKKPSREEYASMARQNLLKTALAGIVLAGGSLLIFHFINGYSLAQLRQIASPSNSSPTTFINDGAPAITIATGTVNGFGSNTTKKPDEPSTSDSLQLFNLMNTVRATPFIYNSELEKIATARAIYLCSTNTFSHDNFKDFFEDSPFNWVGEDLAKSYATEQGVFSAFMQSPAHKAQIQNVQYQYVGVAEQCDITVVSFGGYDTN